MQPLMDGSTPCLNTQLVYLMQLHNCTYDLALLTADAAPDGRQYTLPKYSVVLLDVQLHNCTYDLAILTADAAPHGRQYTLPEYSVGLLDVQLHNCTYVSAILTADAAAVHTTCLAFRLFPLICSYTTAYIS